MGAKDGEALAQCVHAKTNDACMDVRNAYYHCKRQQMDMRSRIRGVRGFEGGMLDAKKE